MLCVFNSVKSCILRVPVLEAQGTEGRPGLALSERKTVVRRTHEITAADFSSHIQFTFRSLIRVGGLPFLSFFFMHKAQCADIYVRSASAAMST